MIDQIRSDIQHRLNQVLAEADKLRRALAALGSHDGGEPASKSSENNSSSDTRPAAKRPRPASSGSQPRSRARAESTGGTATRAASGATRNAVLDALQSGNAMTAGEVASATGLGRASVSTTLSKLAKSGEVTKADRGYRIGSAS